MSTVLELEAEPTPEIPVSPAVRAAPAPLIDTLADSVVALLVLAALQRIVGFVRGILVCRWLSPQQLGEWDMAFGFFVMAAPVVVLGLPGSFGRYVEYFRQRGQLRVLVRRTGLVCLGLCAVGVSTIAAAPAQFSQLVFGRPDQVSLIFWMAGGLVAVIAYNYLTELLTAMRMARLASVVQFFNSLAFAGLSILFLLAWRDEAVSLVAAYAGSCLVLALAMFALLRRSSSSIAREQPLASSSPSGGFWRRLLPFAAWVWVTNVLYNMFEVVDRYMIVHTAPSDDPLALVGYYHSSRLLPLLLISIAALLGTTILPHLSHDWEAGRRREVSTRMNLVLKLVSLLLFCGSIAILLVAPVLFSVAFEGKYGGGLDVLPWTLTYCCWLGMINIGQLYLWCAERARLGCVALFVGLLANIGLNLILLPRFGLIGAVWATATANAIALGLYYWFAAALGMKFDRSVFVLSALPVALGFGSWVACTALIVVAVLTLATDSILSTDEKQRLWGVLNSYRARFTGRQYDVA